MTAHRMRETSLAAYRQALPRLPRREAEIVAYLLDHPEGVTADEFRRIADDRSPNQHAPSFTALSKFAVIVDSGKRRLTELGQPAIVWVLRGSPHGGVPLPEQGEFLL